ncbi:MAG: cob(I)yrinic acid a,c-diamide adenosyltransferase [Bacteroidales bacterium]|nr:cob(I)yrinic acid a,c-diamide adenosyltransferase [Bacteroidales bacterium]
MKIYTKKGDKCQTTLLGGNPVLKNNVRLHAYGTIDELISQLAVLHDLLEWNDIKDWIILIEDKLMICAAHVAFDGTKEITLPHLTENDVSWLEQQIDFMEKELSPLHHFILPGGHIASSQAHVCRTVCRRAERCIVDVYQQLPFDEVILKYTNRLSDFLFVLSRYILKRKGINEIPWNPTSM